MFTDREGQTAVIINFDSCALKGDPLPNKRGLLPEGASTAEFENDEYYGETLIRGKIDSAWSNGELVVTLSTKP
ncbi:uncharacterized protein N7518_002862 [Penicillium psychrosexuale]|uniref:uncharacterized protein n=1 Tax=Penicillium psychrosexuale TaxID=1002107 RepID=UPI002545ADD7|nr:uncharacterized protein N7518_002862 [Penicillium psychrosexuale]KAJ5800794.1 hypothetical protein N7518_002862 [Penicillium psychrosexuale]